MDFLNEWYQVQDRVRMAMSSVRRPILANSFNSASRLSYDFGDSLFFTILSAPFIYILITPLSLTITLILFLSELNGNTYSNSNDFSCPLTLIVVSCFVLRINSQSISLAASTRAISSGDGPWQMSLPFTTQATHQWAMLRICRYYQASYFLLVKVMGLLPYLLVMVIGRGRGRLPQPVCNKRYRRGSWNPFSVCGWALGSLDIRARSPYICCPTQAILNSIKFIVSVPVLSLNTY